MALASPTIALHHLVVTNGVIVVPREHAEEVAKIAREIDTLEARAFPVFACGISMVGTAKACALSWVKPINMIGVDVAPGDLVEADTDGVLVLPAINVEATVAAGIAREAKEADSMKRLTNGATTLELMGLG